MQSNFESFDQAETELAICEHNRAILDQELDRAAGGDPGKFQQLRAIQREILCRIRELELRLNRRRSIAGAFENQVEVTLQP
jgi:hypothetical protein